MNRTAAILHQAENSMQHSAVAISNADANCHSFSRKPARLGVRLICGVRLLGAGAVGGRRKFGDWVSLRDIRGTTTMTLRLNLSESEAAVWDRRNEVLVQGTELMNDKPDMEDWTDRERRLWLYACAIGNRLEQLQ
jgi:hypothetical protein